MEALTQGLGRNDIISLLATNIVAFLILVYILKKYAWGPLLAMLDERRDKVKADYDAASGKLQEAEVLRNDYDAKLAEIKALEREKLQEAVKRGEDIASKIETEARGKAGDFMSKAEADIEREVGSARLELRGEVVGMALAAAEMLVKEKMDDQKHRQMVEDFIANLGGLRG